MHELQRAKLTIQLHIRRMGQVCQLHCLVCLPIGVRSFLADDGKEYVCKECKRKGRKRKQYEANLKL